MACGVFYWRNDMTAEKRKGRQTPTESVVLPYTQTHGADAVELYNKSGRTAQEWQELLQYDILAVNDEGLWVHTKVGYSVPRRNGKNEIIAMREMWGLQNNEKILHTAHRTTTSHAAWERLCNLLDKAKIEYKSIKATGRECIYIKKSDARVEFRTRSSKGGLGEGFDLLVIDEAQEYTDDQESALKYVVSDSRNPQTIMCGTPPTAVSSGTVFTKYRNRTLAGGTANGMWAEWSVENESDVYDKELWYRTNPSLGTILTERAILDEITTDLVDFNIQRLGLWIKYNQKSAISKAEWETLKVSKLPALKGKLFVGIKYGRDGNNVAMSIAVKTKAADKIFVECIDCREVRAGNAWILDFLSRADVQKIVVDGANGQQLLAEEMKEEKLKKPVLPTVKEIITANAAFEQAIAQGQIIHMNQPSLAQAVGNCEKRAIGTNGGFGYKSQIDKIDISLLDSVIYAYWACSSYKEKKKQKVGY